MTAGGGPTDLGQIKAIATAVLEQMDRLGLKWRLRPATVARVDESGAVRAMVDGDLEPIRVVSMVGAVAAGERVMVLTSPPSGNHIVGWAGGRLAGPPTPAVLFGVSGTVAVTFAVATAYTEGVQFLKPFPVAPRVFVNIASVTPTAGWTVRATSVSTTGFSLHVSGTPAAAWTRVPVHWLAVVA